MPLIVGTNSWVTVAEADTYLTDRLGAGNWFTTPNNDQPGITSRKVLLVSAFRWLIASPLLTLTAGSTDDNVKNAQIEAALFLLEHYTELDERRTLQATGVKEIQISRRTEIFDYTQLAIPDHILGYLTEYLTGANTVFQLKGHYDA